MTDQILELKKLIRTVRQTIIDANNGGQFDRVQQLKFKKQQLKTKLHGLIGSL